MSDLIEWSIVISLWAVFALLVNEYRRNKKTQQAMKEIQQSTRQVQAAINRMKREQK